MAKKLRKNFATKFFPVFLPHAALKERGWGSVDKTKIDVQDKSGQGGSKTYKVSGGTGAEPRVVSLHLRSKDQRSRKPGPAADRR